MTEPVLLALISVGSAVLVAPWVKWRIENKRRQVEENRTEKASRRAQILRWREMIATLAANTDHSPQKVAAAIQGHPDYYSLEPYLDHDVRRMVYLGNQVHLVGAQIPSPLLYLKDEIARIEREWGVH
jgi:hypothetical protein